MKKTSTLFMVLLLCTTFLVASNENNVKSSQRKALCKELSKSTRITDYALEIRNLMHQYLSIANENTKSSAAVVQRLDSFYSDAWNLTSSTWENDSKMEYTYNEAMQNTVQVESDWDLTGNVWINVSKTDVYYNATGYVTSFIISDWDAATSTWLNAMKLELVYTDTGLGEMLGYMWNAGTSQWELFTKLTFTVNANNDLVLTVTSVFDAGSGTWFDVSKSEYTYTGENVSMQIDSEFSFATFSWVYATKRTYAYDANNYVSEEVRFDWDETTNAWVNSDKQESVYDGSGNLSVLNYFNWNGSQYVYSMMEEYVYNMTYPISELIFPALDGPSWQFNYMPVSSTLSSMPLPMRSMFMGRSRYFYSEQNSTGIQQVESNLVQLLPNPANDFITVHTVSAGIVKLLVVNQLGSIVLSQEATDNQRISIDHLSSGAYFYQIIDGAKVQSGKLVVQ